MPYVTYTGPHSEVEIADTGQVVRQGEPVEVDADLAARLTEQASNWTAGKPTTKETAR